MKKVVCILSLFALSYFILSCEKEKNETQVVLGSLYGVVTDKTTGEPIKNASVELMDIGLKAVTGDDGNYEFVKVEPGTYYLYVTKTGYKDFKTNDIRANGDGKDKKVDVQLEKLPPALVVVDDYGKAIDILDFGEEEGVVSRSFNILNNSDETLVWNIADNTCKWIESFNCTKGELKAGAAQPVVVKINRSLLNVGANSTVIQIVSNNGSKQLKINAFGRNIVDTKEATDVLAFAAVLNAEIVRDMQPPISEYGFLYGTLPAPSFQNNAHKQSIMGSPQIGMYSMRVEDLERDYTYYFRAFAANMNDTIYGETNTFKTISHTPKFSISINNATATTLVVTYSVSDAGIPLEEVGLCWGVDPLPTRENSFQAFGNEARSYSSTIEGLKINTKYYVRAYAINAEGVHYSSIDKNNKTEDGKPKVSTSASYTPGVDFLIISGSATSELEFPITLQGFCYNTIPNPTIDDHFVEVSLSSTSFSAQLTNLQQGTKYYYRAYAQNTNGYTYGNEQYATTNYGPATLNGYVYDQNGNPVQNAYVDGYDVSGYNTITDALGYYEITFTLKRDATYQFRAYKDGYSEQIKQVTIHPGQVTQQNFSLTADNPATPETGSYITMSDGSFIVQTVDRGSAQWHSANSLCASSTLGGYSDWRLPTLSELKKIYEYRAQIGGFPSRAVTNNNYWSSTPGSKSGYYYYVNFNTGESGEMPRVNSFKVRAVRSN